MTDALAKIKNIRGNSKTLLNFFGFKTIRDARKEFDGTDKSIYQYLKSEYNNEVEQILTEQRRVKRNEKAKVRRQVKKEIKSKQSVCKTLTKHSETINYTINEPHLFVF